MNIYIYGDSNTWGYIPNVNSYSKNVIIKSVELNDKYYNLCKQLNINFISGISAETGEDGEHLTIKGHKYLENKIKEKIIEIFKNKEK